MPKKPLKLSQKIVEQMRSLYLDHVPVTQIARETGIKRTTVQYYVNNYWKNERETVKTELLTEIAGSKAPSLLKIRDLSLKMLLQGLKELELRDRPLSIQEARNLATILESIDKIVKLDAGSPTDILAAVKPSSPRDIKKRLEDCDPFNQIEDMEIINEKDS